MNRAEVDAVLRRRYERRWPAHGRPAASGSSRRFAGQADALEAALLDAFSVDEIERLGLRVGTVHAFQGSEADTVVASLGLVEDDSPARQRFVADANLFNVLVTRARQRMLVVTSLVDGTPASSATTSPTAPAPPAGAAVRWATRGRLGRPARPGAGRERPDRPGGLSGRALDGRPVRRGDRADLPHRTRTAPAAHVERQRTLLRAGWTLRDAFASRWGDDATRAALELASDLKPGRPSVLKTDLTDPKD